MSEFNWGPMTTRAATLLADWIESSVRRIPEPCGGSDEDFETYHVHSIFDVDTYNALGHAVCFERHHKRAIHLMARTALETNNSPLFRSERVVVNDNSRSYMTTFYCFRFKKPETEPCSGTDSFRREDIGFGFSID